MEPPARLTIPNTVDKPRPVPWPGGLVEKKGVEEIVENISSHPDARVGDLEEDKAAEDRTRFERLLRRGADVLDGEAKASATIEFRIIE